MQFLVKNRSDEVVAKFDEEFEADEFVDAHGSFGLTVHPDIEDSVERLREALDARIKWATEYAEEHDDYVNGYAHIVSEQSYDWERCFEEWLDDDYPGAKILAAEIADHFDSSDAEAERNGSDYGGYYGSGCCIWGFKIEEIEEQISVADCPVCTELNHEGILDDCLDRLENEFCISRSKKRVKGDDGKYRDVGRKLVNPYDRDYPAFEVYTVCSGGWDFAVGADRMKELVTEAITRYCERVDSTK